jgi:hypothetical protein
MRLRTTSLTPLINGDAFWGVGHAEQLKKKGKMYLCLMVPLEKGWECVGLAKQASNRFDHVDARSIVGLTVTTSSERKACGPGVCGLNSATGYTHALYDAHACQTIFARL